MNIELDAIRVRLRTPFMSARHSTTDRELLLLRLKGPDGVAGAGEAAPLESHDGVGLDDVRAALEDCRALLTASDGTDGGALLAECARRAVLPQAVAAIDMALWDLAGRRTRQPVWRLLGAEQDLPVAVNATIAAPDRATAAAEAAMAREAGFSCLKVKVGIGDDAGRLAAVRAAAGDGIAIRIDANGGWSEPEAIASLRAFEPIGLELCEEPVSDLAAVGSISAQAHVPLALDESTVLPGALDHRVCDAVCLKLARFGGITGVVQAARRARSAGYSVYLASMLDGPLGIAAALHAAAAIRPDRPCGLATLALFGGRADPLPASGGFVEVPPGPGLGDGLLEWYS